MDTGTRVSGEAQSPVFECFNHGCLISMCQSNMYFEFDVKKQYGFKWLLVQHKVQIIEQWRFMGINKNGIVVNNRQMDPCPPLTHYVTNHFSGVTVWIRMFQRNILVAHFLNFWQKWNTMSKNTLSPLVHKVALL